MSICRLLRHSTTSTATTIRALHYLTLSSTAAKTPNPNPISSSQLLPKSHTFAFSSAEEAAAERRRRKRRLRIEPPLHALQRNPNPPQRDPNAPRLPDSTNALVGPRLNLHNRVQSLIRAFDLDNASLLARNAVYTRTRPTVFTCNAIIAAMYRAKRYNDAIALFKYFFEQHDIVPNVVSYNNLINAHCDEARVDTGLEIYRHIIASAPFSPSPITYRHLTKGLIDTGRVDEAVDLLREMLNKGHGADSLVYNNLIKAFLELGNLEKANEFFNELTERCAWYDGTVNATYMDWWFKQGKDKEGMENYKSFLDKKLKIPPPTGNALLEVLLRYGKKEAAMSLFEVMLDNHTPPTNQGVNSETISIMVNDCFKEGKFDEVVPMFRKAGTKGGSKPFQMDVAGFNNIIVRFCENGMLSEAEEFFAELCSKSLSPDVTSYRTLIDSYLKVQRIDDALRLLTKMVQENLWVVASYGIKVFNELIKNGKAVECAQILTKMGERDPKPDPSVYDVVVRGLCDADAFDTSKDILEQMMRYGVGVPPALKEFVIKAFTNVGQVQEIERVLDESRWRHSPGPSQVQRQPPRTPWGPPQVARDHSSKFPGQIPSGQSEMARQRPYDQQQMAEQLQSGLSQMTGQQPSGSHNTAGRYSSWSSSSMGPLSSGPQQAAGGQPSWSSQRGQHPTVSSQTGEQQSLESHNVAISGHQPSWSPNHPSWSSQAGAQQPSWSSQAGTQQPSWSSQTGTQRPSWSSQAGSQQPSWSSQAGTQQPSWSSQAGTQQPSWSSQAGTQQPSWSSQARTQQPSWSSQTGTWQPSWSPQVGAQHQQPSSWPSQTGAQQKSWSSQTRVQQQQPSWPSQTGAQQSSWPSQTGAQQPSWSSQAGAQQPSWSSQAGAPQPSWSSHMGGQQPSGVTNVAENQQREFQQMSGQFGTMLGQQPNRPPEVAEEHNSPESVEWQNNRRQAAV